MTDAPLKNKSNRPCGSWIAQVDDIVFEQLVVCDANGVDLENTNEVRRYCARNRLNALLGYISRSTKTYHATVKIFRVKFKPIWLDEYQPDYSEAIEASIRPFAKT